ncbi:hypothetical protein TNCV_926281 [Trichonephila clavipes]|nr:hypothetical protein TNCV_926281 [Trichonephila clavipes]
MKCVYEWFARFRECRESLSDNPRSERLATFVSDRNIQKGRYLDKNRQTQRVPDTTFEPGLGQIKEARRTEFHIKKKHGKGKEIARQNLLIVDDEKDHHSSLGIFGPWSVSCGRQIEAGQLELLKSHQKCFATALENY